MSLVVLFTLQKAARQLSGSLGIPRQLPCCLLGTSSKAEASGQQGCHFVLAHLSLKNVSLPFMKPFTIVVKASALDNTRRAEVYSFGFPSSAE